MIIKHKSEDYKENVKKTFFFASFAFQYLKKHFGPENV